MTRGLVQWVQSNLHSQPLNNLPDDFAFIACQDVNAELIQDYFTIDPKEQMWRVSYWNESMTDNQTLLDLANGIRTIREVQATVTCESSQREFRLVFVHFPQSEAIVLRPFGDECPPEMECLEDGSLEHEILLQLLGIDLNAKIWRVDRLGLTSLYPINLAFIVAFKTVESRYVVPSKSHKVVPAQIY